ncbi:uncharacterized protein LOC133923857 isoform X2 [Phragmites australis]|uniref:uncharacterized protein LOC133923857 isoform X2 n=1 Tax=Phragmites australis TaxID=29695 RepID=UPI002D7986C2|nr:uncharacterized protein LOC133923857 isoform X2 [Phragmites australis]
MAMGGSGGAAAPPHGQVYLSEWRRAFDRLVKMLRQTHAQAEALAVERAHLLTELEFHRCGRREREDIFQARIQKISREEARRKRAEKVEAAKRLGKKEMELCCYQKLAELAENDLEDFRSFISTLAAENNELKIKLKEIESQAELSESNVSHQHSAKDLRAELRKLKQAYKTLSSEKDKEISAIRAERNFVWNQHNTMEKEYREICKKKTIEAKQATEAAEKLQQNVDELKVAAQQKDDEINRLRAEVVSAKEKMISLEDELKQMHSMVKGNYVETDKHKDDQPETSGKCKQNINETNRKSKSEGPVSMEKSSNSQATSVKREVKTSRTRVPSAKEIQSQSRGQSDASQKRKRGLSLYAA